MSASYADRQDGTESRVARLGYRPSLDGLRGIAVFSVVGFHEVAFFYPRSDGSVLAGGYLGVDIFFVLSGFLITTLLLEESKKTGTINLVSFWIRRGARLFPAMYVYIAAATIYSVVLLGLGRLIALQSDLSAIFYYLNWRKAAGAGLSPGFGHLWSLAVEEQFYLVWPLVIVAFLKVRTRMNQHVARTLLPVLLGILVIASVVGRAIIWSRDPDVDTVIFYTNFHSDQLLLGALGAFLFTSTHMDAVRRIRHLLWLPAAVLILLAILFVPQTASFLYLDGGYVAFGVLTTVFVLCALEAGRMPGRVLAHPGLVYVGRISYALYLWHFGTITAFSYVLGKDLPVVGVIGSAATAIAIAAVSTRFLELPVRNWVQRRMAPRTSAAVPGR